MATNGCLIFFGGKFCRQTRSQGGHAQDDRQWHPRLGQACLLSDQQQPTEGLEMAKSPLLASLLKDLQMLLLMIIFQKSSSLCCCMCAVLQKITEVTCLYPANGLKYVCMVHPIGPPQHRLETMTSAESRVQLYPELVGDFHATLKKMP